MGWGNWKREHRSWSTLLASVVEDADEVGFITVGNFWVFQVFGLNNILLLETTHVAILSQFKIGLYCTFGKSKY